MDTALGAIGEADVLLAVVDAARPGPGGRSTAWLQKIHDQKRPAILALNKIDLIPDKTDAARNHRPVVRAATPFEAVVPISALDGTQVEALVAAIVKALPAGPAYFPEDTLTDATERFIAAELIREKIFRLTGEEIPYASAVTVEAYKPSADGKRLSIEATIHLERDSQKGIVIGKGGAMLKRIGTEARQDIEDDGVEEFFLEAFVGTEELAQGHQGHRTFRILRGKRNPRVPLVRCWSLVSQLPG
ncbi:MAG: GTPase Era [Desulfobacterales bacterium]|nr:GTPase Era [Desulfobacterales bacterium]